MQVARFYNLVYVVSQNDETTNAASSLPSSSLTYGAMEHRAAARNSKKGNENTEINLDKDKRFCRNVRHTHTC